MRVLTATGEAHEGSVRKFAVGWRLKSYLLDEKDVHEIASLPDDQALALLKQLDGRCYHLDASGMKSKRIDECTT